MDNINYEPIKRKIEAWIWYGENEPKKNKDEFRKKHDLDCILTNGNLHADTIFSLWRSLRFALVRINGYKKLTIYGKVEKEAGFLKQLCKHEVMMDLLPGDNSIVQNLVKLFDFGQTQANVMILPEGQRKLNTLRNMEPYHDYMPYFLSECFDGGTFSDAFKKVLLSEWIMQQKLDMFFERKICKGNIKDLAQTGDIKKGVPDCLDTLLINYIKILEKRQLAFDEMELFIQ
ncbi:hypothetical protein [Clostridium gasigenes]|uniref:Uncharacterized protein n=1 Tax=Clostridium gasigenes TaxID=94869 RepID=A0A7X0SB54_9CLOT|nr:hypothetical protein [Clostridium gasigenes]MBB6714410.1 hypothetical protein [Clostridium gasigenes]